MTGKCTVGIQSHLFDYIWEGISPVSSKKTSYKRPRRKIKPRFYGEALTCTCTLDEVYERVSEEQRQKEATATSKTRGKSAKKLGVRHHLRAQLSLSQVLLSTGEQDGTTKWPDVEQQNLRLLPHHLQRFHWTVTKNLSTMMGTVRVQMIQKMMVFVKSVEGVKTITLLLGSTGRWLLVSGPSSLLSCSSYPSGIVRIQKFLT